MEEDTKKKLELDVCTFVVSTYICSVTIEAAIQQERFTSPQQKSAINTIYTALWLNGQLAHELKPLGLTWQQFNAMRIIRGQKGEPASVKLICERMLDPASNASCIVDKLVAKNWVERTPCWADRRQVDILLTAAGKQVLAKASIQVEQALDQVFCQLDADDHAALNQLLDKLKA